VITVLAVVDKVGGVIIILMERVRVRSGAGVMGCVGGRGGGGGVVMMLV